MGTPTENDTHQNLAHMLAANDSLGVFREFGLGILGIIGIGGKRTDILSILGKSSPAMKQGLQTLGQVGGIMENANNDESIRKEVTENQSKKAA